MKYESMLVEHLSPTPPPSPTPALNSLCKGRKSLLWETNFHCRVTIIIRDLSPETFYYHYKKLVISPEMGEREGRKS